nr:MAG TPA_asm: hypothetical protein [Caudoviricetes sp.]
MIRVMIELIKLSAAVAKMIFLSTSSLSALLFFLLIVSPPFLITSI